MVKTTPQMSKSRRRVDATESPDRYAPPTDSRKIWIWRTGPLRHRPWPPSGRRRDAISGKTDELQGATTYLAHLHWEWLAVAFGAEAASYLAMSLADDDSSGPGGCGCRWFA